ncbi:MAG: helix-turn-helix domain-containing protein [bacterium]
MAKGEPEKRYTGTFKQQVVETMRAERLGYCETARRFHVSCNKRIASWERIYLEEGPEGLYKERRGRPLGAVGTGMKRRPQLDRKAEESLIAENQRLRAENTYLKNLQALVLEDERRQRKRHW